MRREELLKTVEGQRVERVQRWLYTPDKSVFFEEEWPRLADGLTVLHLSDLDLRLSPRVEQSDIMVKVWEGETAEGTYEQHEVSSHMFWKHIVGEKVKKIIDGDLKYHRKGRDYVISLHMCGSMKLRACLDDHDDRLYFELNSNVHS